MRPLTIASGDVPVFINNRLPNGPSKGRNHYLHHPGHASEIERACENAGVRCLWVESAKHKTTDTDPMEFVLNVLLPEGGERRSEGVPSAPPQFPGI